MANELSELVNKMADDFSKAMRTLFEEKETEPKIDILTANKLHELRFMSPRQLAAVYKYGAVQTKIVDDPDAYHELRWMTEAQLQAIFGKGGMNQ